jgi:hypothetical protein
MWEVAQEESFRKMIENPSMKIMHDEFEHYVMRMINLPRPTREFPIPLK